MEDERGKFEIKITGIGKHCCDDRTEQGERLRRCNRMTCVDCLAYDFAQMLRQKGFRLVGGTFTHFPGAVDPEKTVVDDLLTNTRQSGRF